MVDFDLTCRVPNDYKLKLLTDFLFWPKYYVREDLEDWWTDF